MLEIIPHEDYRYRGGPDDIALLRIAPDPGAPAPRGAAAPLPIPIADGSPGRLVKVNDEVMVRGWGRTVPAPPPPSGARPAPPLVVAVLQQVPQTVLAPAVCQAAFRDGLIADGMICATGKPGQDSCNGDSGGPMTREHRGSPKILVGLVSWGSDVCGSKPGVYTERPIFCRMDQNQSRRRRSEARAMKMPRFSQAAALLLAGGVLAQGAALLLAGCAVSPHVVYHSLSDAHRGDGWTPYRLTDTTVIIGKPGEKGAGPAEGDRPGQPVQLEASDVSCEKGDCRKLAIVAAPIDDDSEVLAIEPRTRRLVTTSLAPAYWPNSLRLKTLSIEVRDHKIEAINTVGAIVAGVGKMAATGGARSASPGADAGPLHLPIVLDLSDLKMARRPRPLPGHPAPVEGTEGWKYSAKFLDDPAKEGFLPRSQRSSVHGAMLTSTCRPMLVELFTGNGVYDLSFRVRVADPDWLTPIPLPAIGAVVLHPLCGADVQAQKIVEVGADAAAEAFFKQVDAVRGAGK